MRRKQYERREPRATDENPCGLGAQRSAERKAERGSRALLSALFEYEAKRRSEGA